VEAESARLAAMFASEIEIQEIEEAVKSHLAEVERGGIAGEQNRAIHRMVAKASKSRVLLAVVNLILEDQQLQETQQRLAPLQIGEWGQLQEWLEDWDDPEDHHRHLSPLWGLYPGHARG
jgi:DNA-binding FadR family transcriptional regulator